MALKIAILGTRGIPAHYGGFETIAEELGARLAHAGFQVTVYCEAKAPPIGNAEYRGIKLRYISCPRLGPLTSIVFDSLCLIDARRGFDVVYVLGYSASFLCFLPRLSGARVWINVDGVEWERTKWSWMGRLYLKAAAAIALKTATHIIADANEIAWLLRGRYGSMRSCTTIAYGANLVQEVPSPALLATWGLSPADYYLVVCRLEPENHVMEVIREFLSSSTRRILVIVGNHHVTTRYVRRLLAAGKSERIKFIGTVYNKDQLSALRYYCFAYFHGHSVGGTNPSLLEAMASGSAIIAHDNKFNREVAGVAALYFGGENSIVDLSAQIELDGSLHRRLKAQAKQRVVDHYSWEIILSQYQNLLNKGD